MMGYYYEITPATRERVLAEVGKKFTPAQKRVLREAAKVLAKRLRLDGLCDACGHTTYCQGLCLGPTCNYRWTGRKNRKKVPRNDFGRAVRGDQRNR